MKKLKFKWKNLVFPMIFVVGIFAWGIFVIPRVFGEEPKTIDVQPGAGTLKAAVAEANPGDTLKLTSGAYTGLSSEADKTVEINKKLTIIGSGNYTTVDVPISIKTNQEVSLSNFTTTIVMVEPNYIYFKVDEANANLTLSDIILRGMLRGGADGKYPRHDATFIDVTPTSTSANITVNNCSFEKPGVNYGIRVKASETDITLDNTLLIGRVALSYENGQSNKFTAKNGSKIQGPSAIYTDTKGIVLKDQKDLTFTVDGSEVIGMIPSNSAAISLFSFEGETTGTTIDIKNGSSVALQEKQDEEPNAESVIFGFSSSAKQADNNIVKIDPTSKMYISVEDKSYQETARKLLPVKNKYSKVNNATVVGLYQRDGSGEIKVYDEGSTIEELSQEPYVTKEGYGDGTRFKGWFKQYNWLEEETVDFDPYSEEYAKQETDYPALVSGENMDLYPKFVKLFKVKIGETEDILEFGQTLGEISEIDTKLNNLKKEGQDLKGYIMHGTTGGEISEVVQDPVELKKIKITEDVTVEAVHTVKVKVNWESVADDDTKVFEVETGKKVDSITNQDAYNTAKLNGRDEEDFSRLVYKRDGEVTDETFDEENTPINENIELVTKHYAKVTLVEDDVYKVEEGKAISTNEDLKNAMDELEKAPVLYKEFKQFEDSKNTVITTDSTITEATTIKPVYQIKVVIGEKTYTLDEGKTLKSLSAQEQEIKNALQALVDAAGERNLDGFILSVTDSTDKEVLKTSSDKTAEVLIGEILDKALSKNTTIYAEYNAVVTIECSRDICGDNNKFEIETGKTLKDVAAAEEYVTDFEKAKYQKYSGQEDKEARFYHFVDSEGKEFKETDEIEKSITLTPKYFAFVTIDDAREDVKGKYKVEESKKLDDLIGEDAKAALAKLRSNIVALEETEKENLHFDKLVKVEGEGESDYDANTPISEDITIRAKYHYDVTIVENYDDPQNNDETSSHSKGLKVYRDKALNSQQSAVEDALSKLEASANKEDDTRKFDGYVEVNSNTEYTKEALLEKVFNTHIYINAKVKYRVKIGGQDYYVREGKTLKDVPEVVEALNKLKVKDNATFADQFTIDEEEKTEEEVLNTEVTKAIEINAKYSVTVKIGEESFTIPENGKLSDYGNNDAVSKALKALDDKVTTDGFNFKGYYYIYSDGTEKTDFATDDISKTTFSKNATIEAKYNIKIIIGDYYFEIDSSQTLKDIPEEKQADYKTATTKDNRKFSKKFRNDKGQIFTEESTFTKNEELTPIFNVEITIKGEKHEIEEGTKLGTDEIKEALKVFETDDKIVHGYVDEKSQPVDLEGNANDNITITPVYYVSLTVQYGDQQLGYFELPENKSIDELEGEFADIKTKIQEALGKLTTAVENDHYHFIEYRADDTKFENTTKVTKNTVVTAKYNVEVTIKGATGTKYFQIESGQTLADVKSSNSSDFDTVKTKADRHFLYFVIDGTDTVLKEDDTTYQFMKNAQLTAIFGVTVKIDKNYYLEENKPLSSNADIVKALKALEKDDQRLVEYHDKNGELVATVDDVNNKTDKAINENIEIQGKYVIDVEIVGKDTFKKTVDVGTTLEDVGYSEPENFLRFEDYKTNEEVEKSTSLNKHTKLKAIYKIKVIANDKTYELESFQTFGDLHGKDDADDTLEAIKADIPEGRISFSRFVYIKDGEEIELNDDTVLTDDITVVPKYTIEITVVYRTDDGNQEELVKIELEEGRTIGDLTTDELTKLNQKLREREAQLEEEGKHNFKFSKFIYEDGSSIDMKKTSFDEPTTIVAIFEYKAEPTPIDPSVYPDEELAPDTGVVVQQSPSQDMIGMVIITILSVIGCRIARVVRN